MFERQRGNPGVIDFVLPGAMRYYPTVNTLTIKISSTLDRDLLQMSEKAHLSESELVRRGMVAYIGQRATTSHIVSALDQAGDLVGCFSDGTSDLSSNPKYLEGFGKV